MTDRNRRQRARDLLARHPVFACLPEEAVASLVRSAELNYVDTDEALYTSGSPARHVYAILEGALQIEYPKRGASRGVVVAMLKAPCILGECQALHGRVWSGTGIALVPTMALGIDTSLLERTVLDHPALGMALYREVTLRFLNAIDTWKAEPDISVDEQLARYVLSCLEATDADGTLKMAQSVLGRATGLRRETINRILKRWESRDVLQSGARGLTAINRPQLEEIAGVSGTTLVQHL